jgi:hypothetical protein
MMRKVRRNHHGLRRTARTNQCRCLYLVRSGKKIFNQATIDRRGDRRVLSEDSADGRGSRTSHPAMNSLSLKWISADRGNDLHEYLFRRSRASMHSRGGGSLLATVSYGPTETLRPAHCQCRGQLAHHGRQTGKPSAVCGIYRQYQPATDESSITTDTSPNGKAPRSCAASVGRHDRRHNVCYSATDQMGGPEISRLGL